MSLSSAPPAEQQSTTMTLVLSHLVAGMITAFFSGLSCVFIIWDCERYPQLPIQCNVVSINNVILSGKQPFSVTNQVTYPFPFPSFSGPEHSVNQMDRPNRFLFPLPTSLKVPGCQADCSFPHRLEGPRHPASPRGGDVPGTEQGSVAAHGALSTKSKSYKS